MDMQTAVTTGLRSPSQMYRTKRKARIINDFKEIAKRCAECGDNMGKETIYQKLSAKYHVHVETVRRYLKSENVI